MQSYSGIEQNTSTNVLLPAASMILITRAPSSTVCANTVRQSNEAQAGTTPVRRLWENMQRRKRVIGADVGIEKSDAKRCWSVV
jgi:hypothetical protein